VDEATSGRAPCGMALRDRQTGWQGSVGRSSRHRFLEQSRTSCQQSFGWRGHEAATAC
jgi:hypothetical protein